MNTNDYTIRQEKKEEQRAVENLVRESFWNVYRPKSREQSKTLSASHSGTCTARAAASTM